MKLVKRNISGFAVVVSLIVVFTVLFILFSPQEPLKPYKEELSPSSETVSEIEQGYIEYSDEELKFTVQVPDNWTKITKDGCPTWICKEFNSSLQIQIFPSSSELLNLTGDGIKQEIESVGGELVDFRWLDEWDYTVSYRMFQQSGTTAHIVVTAFNTQTAIRFAFVITEEYYEKVSPVLAVVLDSFVWDRFSA